MSQNKILVSHHPTFYGRISAALKKGQVLCRKSSKTPKQKLRSKKKESDERRGIKQIGFKAPKDNNMHW